MPVSVVASMVVELEPLVVVVVVVVASAVELPLLEIPVELTLTLPPPELLGPALPVLALELESSPVQPRGRLRVRSKVRLRPRSARTQERGRRVIGECRMRANVADLGPLGASENAAAPSSAAAPIQPLRGRLLDLPPAPCTPPASVDLFFPSWPTDVRGRG